MIAAGRGLAGAGEELMAWKDVNPNFDCAAVECRLC